LDVILYVLETYNLIGRSRSKQFCT